MGKRRIVVAAVQPAAPRGADEHAEMIRSAWNLVAEAADDGAELIVLPEYFNVMGLPIDQVPRRSERTGEVLRQAAAFCRRRHTWMLLPLIEQRGKHRFNTAHLLGPDGRIVFTYNKTHLTLIERCDHGLNAGDRIDVVQTPLGRIGVMICYDVYFPEVARTLSLRGADIILFPSLQRSDTEERCMLLNRVRALDSTCYLVRSSFGLKPGETYRTGQVYGASCIVAPDGTVLADAGLYVGVATAAIDPTVPWERPRCRGAEPQAVRDFLNEDRRPELYGAVAGNPERAPPIERVLD